MKLLRQVVNLDKGNIVADKMNRPHRRADIGNDHCFRVSTKRVLHFMPNSDE